MTLRSVQEMHMCRENLIWSLNSLQDLNEVYLNIDYNFRAKVWG